MYNCVIFNFYENMLSKILSLLILQMNDYLKLRFRLREDIVFASPPVKDTVSSFPANRISISIINLEKENMGGIPHSQQAVAGSLSKKTAVTWQINAYLLVAAVFLEKQYSESVQLLSGALSFLQKNNQYSVANSSKKLTTEVVNMSFQELSNLWSVCGGSYYPSVICKVRGIEIDESEIVDFSGVISQHDVNPEIK